MIFSLGKRDLKNHDFKSVLSDNALLLDKNSPQKGEKKIKLELCNHSRPWPSESFLSTGAAQGMEIPSLEESS